MNEHTHTPEQRVLDDAQSAFERLHLLIHAQSLHHGHVVQLRVRVAAQDVPQAGELLKRVCAALQECVVLIHQTDRDTILQNVVISSAHIHKNTHTLGAFTNVPIGKTTRRNSK